MTKHVVIATYGSSGDVFPFVEIGRYLVSRRYRVSFITTSWYEHVVKAGGMEYVPFGTIGQAVELLNDPAIWHSISGGNVIWAKAIQPNIHGVRLYLRSLKRTEEVVVFCHPLMMPLVDLARADRENLRIALFYLQPSAIRTLHGRVMLGSTAFPKCPRWLTQRLYSVLDRLFFDVGVVPGLNREREALGLAPIEHFRPYLCSAANVYITLFPAWYAPQRPDYPAPLISGDFVRHSPSTDPLSDELTAFLNAGRPPILFTAGTPTQHLEGFFEIAADAVRQLHARAIFLTGFREQLPRDLPASVLWQTYVPFDRCLPRVSIIVHHGGMGTFAEASRAGIPQLIVPFAHDHFENARIITGLGIGAAIPLRSLTRGTLARKLAALQHARKVEDRCLHVASQFHSSLTVADIVDKVLATLAMAPLEPDPEENAVLELLDRLATRGLKLSVEGNQLNCYAPNGALTHELRESIIRHKPRLMAVLGDDWQNEIDPR